MFGIVSGSWLAGLLFAFVAGAAGGIAGKPLGFVVSLLCMGTYQCYEYLMNWLVKTDVNVKVEKSVNTVSSLGFISSAYKAISQLFAHNKKSVATEVEMAEVTSFRSPIQTKLSPGVAEPTAAVQQPRLYHLYLS